VTVRAFIEHGEALADFVGWPPQRDQGEATMIVAWQTICLTFTIEIGRDRL
jgi:hypothetical protein